MNWITINTTISRFFRYFYSPIKGFNNLRNQLLCSLEGNLKFRWSENFKELPLFNKKYQSFQTLISAWLNQKHVGYVYICTWSSLNEQVKELWMLVFSCFFIAYIYHLTRLSHSDQRFTQFLKLFLYSLRLPLRCDVMMVKENIWGNRLVL